MLAALPANWYSLEGSVAPRAKRPQALVLHLLLLPRVAKWEVSFPFKSKENNHSLLPHQKHKFSIISYEAIAAANIFRTPQDNE